jgi:hypothetical protein
MVVVWHTDPVAQLQLDRRLVGVTNVMTGHSKSVIGRALPAAMWYVATCNKSVERENMHGMVPA